MNALAVYVFLCAHAGPSGHAWPETESIAASLGVSRRTVQRAVRSLKDTCEIEDHPMGFRVLDEDERNRRRRRRS